MARVYRKLKSGDSDGEAIVRANAATEPGSEMTSSLLMPYWLREAVCG
jgi:hypothetical protein